MRDQPNPIAQHGAISKRPYRGRLYVALHGPGNNVQGISLCTTFLDACFWLAGWPKGSILIAEPGEGAPLRAYLADGPPPFPCEMQAHPESIVAEVRRVTDVSRSTARDAVLECMRDHAGVGWQLYSREQEGAKNNRFGEGPL